MTLYDVAVLDGEAIDDLDALGSAIPGWDELAADNGHPQMSPAWTLGWLRHLAPEGTEPRIVVVREGSRVVGVAPLYIDTTSPRVDYRIANIEMSAGLSLLAAPGREQEVAATIASVLSEQVTPARTSSPSRGLQWIPPGRSPSAPPGQAGFDRPRVATSPIRVRRWR